MHIAVLSDLHLGAGDAADGFGHDDGEFLGFLRRLERGFERIVLLGDVWETLTGLHPARPTAALEAARRAHPEIAAQFRRPQYTWIHGNHDIVAGVAERVPERWRVEVDGVRLLFTHGHQSDRLVRHARGVSEVGVWLGGWLRRLGLRKLYEVFSRLDDERSGSAGADDPDFERWAFALAGSERADVVVTGHTHRALSREREGRLLLNSGSCSGGALQFLSLDTRRGAFTVHA